MGRPYESELAEFADTYVWSMDASVETLASSLAQIARKPLIAVGSGGSLTSASIACVLHTRFTGMLTRVMTPYELAMSPLALKEYGVLLCTAGGSNPDVLSCFEGLIRRESSLLAAVCTRTNSPLSKLASSHDWIHCHEFPTPVRKDGFLATNSLLATIVLLVRTYEHIFSVESSLPPTMEQLLNTSERKHDFLSTLLADYAPLSERRTLVVLHGSTTQPAAADIESRFTEAALGNVQLADYRNFAHGRHHWLAKKADETAVLILSGPEEKAAAERTASLLPKSIPSLHLRFPHGLTGMVSAVLHSIYLGSASGKLQGIDPGRPKVPQFGRRLYHVRAIPKTSLNGIGIREFEANAIERKTGLTVPTLYTRNQLEEWRDHFRTFSRRLTKASFNGVIFDYDGTLCGSAERYGGLRKEVVTVLRDLVRAGVCIGIATGRGKSVKKELRSHIRQRSLRKQIMIGYHNAGEIGLLDDEDVPPSTSPLDASLKPIRAGLMANHFITLHTTIEAKGRQITLETKSPQVTQDVWNYVSDIVRHHAGACVQLVQSTHSIDVLASDVSKRSLIAALADHMRHASCDPVILCIGDRGRWPGNDFDLLAHPFALSVDETSGDPTTCWNLAPPRSRYVDACLHYLRHFEIDGGKFRIRKLAEKSR